MFYLPFVNLIIFRKQRRVDQVIIFSAMFFVVAVLPFYSTHKIDIVLSGNAVFYSCIFYKELSVWTSSESF